VRHCKKRLRKLIVEHCLQTGDFTLSSGGKSSYFIDLSKLYVTGQGAYLIGKTIYHHTKNMEFDAIGGPVMGALPLTVATVVHYWRRQRCIKEGFYVRWKKDDDLKRSYRGVDGWINSGNNAIIVEDVCTTGASAAVAVEAVWELVGCKVVSVIALVDREEGARERFKEMGVNFESIFTAKKLVGIAVGEGLLAPIDKVGV
jgi:orotate phosphoribosyltransferase